MNSQSQNKNQSKLESEQEQIEPYKVRPVGKVTGPLNPSTQKPNTFQYVLGLFDDDGKQLVHTMKNGEQRPIVFLSLPLLLEEERIIL